MDGRFLNQDLLYSPITHRSTSSATIFNQPSSWEIWTVKKGGARGAETIMRRVYANLQSRPITDLSMGRNLDTERTKARKRAKR